MRLILLIFVILTGVHLPRLADASTPQQHYEVGVQAARSGDFDTAIGSLAEAVRAGGRDPAVYHALGNALYRAGKRGQAVAAWRRAQTLQPRNGDLAANLDRARSESQDRIDRTHSPWTAWRATISPAEMLWLLSGLLTLALVLMLVRLLRTPSLGLRGARGPETMWLLLASALPLTAIITEVVSDQEGVIVVPESSVRSAIGPAGVELFRLHEGAEVRIVEESKSDVLIALPDDRKGWVPMSAIVSAHPSSPLDSTME